MLQAVKLPDARKGKRPLIAFATALFLIFCVGAIFSAITHESSRRGKDLSNNISQLAAGVNKVMQETSRAGAILSAGIEPPPLANSLASAKSRADLERYLSTLKMAEGNAASAMPRYEALLTRERNEIENLSNSLNIADNLTRDLLSRVDKQHAERLAFVSQTLVARVEIYRALENTVAVAIENYGSYSVDPNYHLHFVDRSAADQFNAATRAVSVAIANLNEVAAQGKQLEQSEQKAWRSFAIEPSSPARTAE
jgi:hypothetical protein